MKTETKIFLKSIAKDILLVIGCCILAIFGTWIFGLVFYAMMNYTTIFFSVLASIAMIVIIIGYIMNKWEFAKKKAKEVEYEI